MLAAVVAMLSWLRMQHNSRRCARPGWKASSVCGVRSTLLDAPVCTVSWPGEGTMLWTKRPSCWPSQAMGVPMSVETRSRTTSHRAPARPTVDQWPGVGPSSVSSTCSPRSTNRPSAVSTGRSASCSPRLRRRQAGERSASRAGLEAEWWMSSSSAARTVSSLTWSASSRRNGAEAAVGTKAPSVAWAGGSEGAAHDMARPGQGHGVGREARKQRGSGAARGGRTTRKLTTTGE